MTIAAHAEMLVSTEWLAQRLDDPSLAILHVGSREDYDAGHVPGARLVTLADISITGERGLRLELPPEPQLRAALEKLGIGDESRVVVYAGTESVQSATRVWFTLDYVGMGAQTSLLDGGLALWRAEGRPVSTEAKPAAAAAFTGKGRPELVVDATWIHSHLTDSGVQLVDTRTPEFYSGESAGRMPRAGHIPGARSLPYTSMLDARRKLRPMDELRTLLGDGDQTVVSYCHIGQQATVLYFVARYLGREVRLYDGSFQDWSMRRELPVETSVQKAR